MNGFVTYKYIFIYKSQIHSSWTLFKNGECNWALLFRPNFSKLIFFCFTLVYVQSNWLYNILIVWVRIKTSFKFWMVFKALSYACINVQNEFYFSQHILASILEQLFTAALLYLLTPFQPKTKVVIYRAAVFVLRWSLCKCCFYTLWESFFSL